MKTVSKKAAGKKGSKLLKTSKKITKKCKAVVTSPLDQLKKFMSCDLLLGLHYENVLTKDEAKEKFHSLNSSAFDSGLSVAIESWKKKTAFLGLKITPEALVDDLPQGNVIIGPEADNLHEVQKFHALWQKPRCQLRRFQDGKIRESVLIGNPYGPAYFPLAKLKSLLEIHLPDVDASFQTFKEEILAECFEADKVKEKLRSSVNRFINFIQEVTQEGSLPLRQVRANCDCLHSGERSHGHFVSNVEHVGSKLAIDKSGYLNIKEKADMAPAQAKAIDILMEITLKDKLAQELFSRMKMTFTLALKSLLEKNKLNCMIQQNSDLTLIFQNVLFRIRIQSPNSISSNDPKNPWKLASLSEFINRVGSSHPAWNSLCNLVRRWSNNSGLELAFPAVILDLISASLFFDAGKVQPQLGSTSTVERSFLTFLYRLSFTDFSSNVTFLTTPEEFDSTSFAAKFSEHRHTFPPLCIITPFDVTPSSFTKDLDAMTLTRLVNCARKSLHSFSARLPDASFKTIHTIDYELLLNCNFASAFDVIIHLKPLQIPLTKCHANDNSSTQIKTFPVVGYDPVQYYIDELRECFGNVANFYFSRSAHTVGVKFLSPKLVDDSDKVSAPNKPSFDPALLVEDAKVIGKGLVKDVDINFVQ